MVQYDSTLDEEREQWNKLPEDIHVGNSDILDNIKTHFKTFLFRNACFSV